MQKKMAACKEDDRQSHQIGIKVVPHFSSKQRNRFIFRHLMLKKSLERFITEYIPDVKLL